MLSLMMADTDPEEKKLVNKVITIFFVHKKYSRSFITLQLNHWCHMDVFNDVFTTFLGLKYFSSVAVFVFVFVSVFAVRKLSGFHQKYRNLCSEYEHMF